MNEATDKLREMLDERGIEHEDAKYKRNAPITAWHSGGSTFCFVEGCGGETDLHIDNATPEQAIAATLGSGKLTAEQVRVAIERNFGKVAVVDDGGETVEWRDGWTCNVGCDFKAITDELNAELGGGDDKSRWAELFGTPERAAKTLSIMQRCELGIIGNCEECEMHDACKVRDGDYDALLEWLRGDA